MKGLILDIHQFYFLNYEDWMRLFEEEKHSILSRLSEKDKEKFNPYHFDYKQTKELFKIYEHILISPDDNLWGAIGKKYFLIINKGGLYTFALSYFNKDLGI